MKINLKYAYLAVLMSSFSSIAIASETVMPAMPNLTSGQFFMGAGVNSLGVANQQSFSTNQTVTVTNNSSNAVNSSGQVEGTSVPYDNSAQSTFVPTAQIGYIKSFADSDYLWGAKLAYQYLGTTVTQNSVTVTTDTINDNTYTASTLIGSAQNSISHEFLFTPFVGKTLTNNSYLYFGAGPAVFDVRTDEYNVRSTSSSNGQLGSTGVNYSDSQWVWGGAAEIGVNYFLPSGWFLDINYTYAMTQHYTNAFNVASGFASTNNTTTTDSGSFSVSQYSAVQTIGLTINKLF